jgi:predicted deacylase
MKIKHYTLPEHALGGQRQLSHFHFGAPGTGEKVYLQAGLHADEIPGMLVLHYLKRLLSQAERRGELRGEIILVPVANPPGLAQVLLSSGIGRFDLASGRNFNRDFPRSGGAGAGRFTGGFARYAPRVSAAGARGDAGGAGGASAVSEAQALRHHLLSLACDADLVLDLHCDDQAILHLYADPAWQREAKVLAAFLGIGAVLLSQESGGNSFDEACGLPWQRPARNPSWRQQQPGCMAVTVELRGQQEVNHATACDDAERIYRYLQYRGVLAGEARLFRSRKR